MSSNLTGYTGPGCTTLITPSIQAYIDNPGTFLGPWLIGAVFEFFFCGILIIQVSNYVKLFPKDPIRTKILVGAVAVFNFLRCVMAFSIVWNKFILHFGDYAAAIGAYGQIWPEATEPLTTAIVGAIVQTYFAFRVFRLFDHNYVILIVVLACIILGLGGSVGLTIEIYTVAGFGPGALDSVICMLAGVFACDCLITMSIFFYFYKHRTGFHVTDTVIDRVLKVTWMSALPPALCAMINLGLYVQQSASSWDYIALNMMLPELYSISLVFTLNSRLSIFAGLDGSVSATGNRWTTGRSGKDLTASEHNLRAVDAKGMPVRVGVQTDVFTLSEAPGVRKSAEKFDPVEAI